MYVRNYLPANHNSHMVMCQYELNVSGNKSDLHYILIISLSFSLSLLVRRTLKNDLTPEEAQALCLEALVMQVWRYNLYNLYTNTYAYHYCSSDFWVGESVLDFWDQGCNAPISFFVLSCSIITVCGCKRIGAAQAFFAGCIRYRNWSLWYFLFVCLFLESL